MGRKSGFVAITGLPNAGKSTLLNTLIRQKLSIVSPRPQTTRYRIEGIFTSENTQMIFVDTPGFIKAEKGLNHILQSEIEETIKNSDIILLIAAPENLMQHDTKNEVFDFFVKKIRDSGKPFIIALNKCDTLSRDEIKKALTFLSGLNISDEIIDISALNNTNTDKLIAAIERYLPEGEFLYDPEQIAIKSERFLAQEMIREQLFYLLKKEIPYECAVTIEEFDETERDAEDVAKRIVRINGVIYVSRESLKPIVIGRGGEMIKRIGTLARQNIEELLGCRVFLNLRVTVKKNWNTDRLFLSELGYEKV
ncbi:MAG: GTPase Era [Deltaproteobacteria bacterium]|nr:GTPase Era [Deltaproteobacteria bacterium]